MKKPRLFYYEEAVDAWIPAPDQVENILETESLFEGEVVDIQFKRYDMTDEEFNNMPEA